MSEFESLMSSGFAETAQQIGCTVIWRGKTLVAVRGSSEALDIIDVGGAIGSSGGYFLIDRAAIAAAFPGEMIGQEEILISSGVPYKVQSIDDDSADPIIRVIVHGPEQ